MAEGIARLLNPLSFHIQKVALELKCPLCLNMLTKPMLLPCDHIFCNICVPRSTQVQCECPVCKHQYAHQEIRAAPHMENMIAIYRSLHATFNAKASQSQYLDAGRSEQPERNAEEIDLNQLQQQSPGSSLSSDTNKDIVKETSELRERVADTKSHTAKRSEEDNSAVVEGLVDQRVPYENVSRDVKRQKKLSYGLSMSLQGHAHNQQSDTSPEIIVNSDCNLMCKLSDPSLVTQPKAFIDQHIPKGSVCAFCHLSKITEATGEMLHYANGMEVVGDVTSLSKAIPVHRNCIDWAPQVYYDGDIIRNLEAELARASKLRCSYCGLKGAALGCLVKSCRKSYHMPCAIEIQGCRWDYDDFVMLCPSHKSVKFPSEKSKSRKRASTEACPISAPLNIEDTVPSLTLACRTPEQPGFWATSSNGPKEWVLCGSALSSEEKYMLVKFANMCGATVYKSWKPNVTHVIASTDEEGACTRTLKVLMAILKGKWILTTDWIRACTESNGPVNEEPYEISLDNHGCIGGPKAGRLKASTNEPKLFGGLKFYLIGEYVTDYKCDLFDLVEEGGGSVIATKEQLDHAYAMQATSGCLVVYNRDPPRECIFGEESNILLQRRAKAEEVANQIGSQIIPHTWILESIAACKLVPFC